jgi:propanol-preferring alcohol dehydrogenase
MKAAVAITNKFPLTLLEVDVPTPKNKEILVKIRASGCCHTDIHAVEGDWYYLLLYLK